MKSFKIFLLIFVFSLTFSSCDVRTVGNGQGHSKQIPPGQAKKIFGTKSAKPFAPGQNKQK